MAFRLSRSCFHGLRPGPPVRFVYQYVKDRASRRQSESSLSGFVEAPPIFERSSRSATDFRAQLKEHRQTPFPFVDSAKLGTILEPTMAFRVACSNMF